MNRPRVTDNIQTAGSHLASALHLATNTEEEAVVQIEARPHLIRALTLITTALEALDE